MATYFLDNLVFFILIALFTGAVIVQYQMRMLGNYHVSYLEALVILMSNPANVIGVMVSILILLLLMAIGVTLLIIALILILAVDILITVASIFENNFTVRNFSWVSKKSAKKRKTK